MVQLEAFLISERSRAAHLFQTDQARSAGGKETRPIGADVEILANILRFYDRKRSWTDDAHVAFDNVYQLRQLINIRAPQKFADFRQTVIVVDRSKTRRFGVFEHGAQFINDEDASILPCAALKKERCTGTFDGDQSHANQNEGSKTNQSRAGACDVDQSLCERVELIARARSRIERHPADLFRLDKGLQWTHSLTEFADVLSEQAQSGLAEISIQRLWGDGSNDNLGLNKVYIHLALLGNKDSTRGGGRPAPPTRKMLESPGVSTRRQTFWIISGRFQAVGLKVTEQTRTAAAFSISHALWWQFTALQACASPQAIKPG